LINELRTMGGNLGREEPTRRVALVGLTETGKSHFLSVLCGDGTEVTAQSHGPTCGMDRVHYRAGRRTVEFVEFGWTLLTTGVTRDLQKEDEPFHTLVWFIDAHDTQADVHDARSVILAFRETQPSTVALCIVLNKGRPHARRRLISRGRWAEPDEQGHGERKVSWSLLPAFADIPALRNHFGAGVYATELSYMDPHAAALCLDWIIDPQGSLL